MAKQLFNSTEKSNFILNLTEEKYSKLASWGLLSACLMVSLATVIPTIAGVQIYAVSSIGLAVAGVICMITALIGFMKKYIRGITLVPVCAFGFMLIWGIVSLADSYDVNISFYGYTGRGEGLLALIFYACFFVTATAVKSKDAIIKLIYGIVITGLLNSVFGLIQIFTGKLSEYRMVSMEIQINAASGLAQSPLFLAMLLTLSLTGALIGFVFFQKKQEKVFCIVSACIFSFVIIFTYSLIGICGIVLSLISLVIVIFVMKAPKINLLALFSVIVPSGLAVLIVQCGLIGSVSQYRLYDGRILWFADSYYRISASGNYNYKVIDIDDTYEVYYYLNRRTIEIIESYSLTGTGEEQLVFPQLYTNAGYGEDADISDIISNNTGTFDKVYNEYLYTAATRGIPSAVALVVILVAVLAIGLKRFRKKKEWQTLCVLVLASCGVLIFFVGCSNICFSAVFWSVAGICCAEIKD